MAPRKSNPQNNARRKSSAASNASTKSVPETTIPDYCQYNFGAYPYYSRGIAFRVIDGSNPDGNGTTAPAVQSTGLSPATTKPEDVVDSPLSTTLSVDTSSTLNIETLAKFHITTKDSKSGTPLPRRDTVVAESPISPKTQKPFKSFTIPEEESPISPGTTATIPTSSTRRPIRTDSIPEESPIDPSGYSIAAPDSDDFRTRTNTRTSTSSAFTTTSSTSTNTFVSTPPNLSSAHAHLNSREHPDPDSPFTTLWTTWDRALGQARWLQRRASVRDPTILDRPSQISIQVLDLDVLSYYSPIYLCTSIVEELHRLKLGRNLRTRNYDGEIFCYTNVMRVIDEFSPPRGGGEGFDPRKASVGSCGSTTTTTGGGGSAMGRMLELPAGGVSRSLQTYFGSIYLPKEVWEEVEKYADSGEEGRVRMAWPEGYYTSAFRTHGSGAFGGVTREQERSFDSVVSWLFLRVLEGMGGIGGGVEEGKFLQLVQALSEVKSGCRIYGRMEVQMGEQMLRQQRERCPSISVI